MTEEQEVSVAEMDRLINEMFELSEAIDTQKSKLTEMNKELAQKEAAATEKLKALGRKSYNAPKGRLDLRAQWWFTLPQGEENRKAMFMQFKETGGEALLYKMATVNANSYSAYCREEWEQAKADGTGMEYRGPGGSEPKMRETVAMVRKR